MVAAGPALNNYADEINRWKDKWQFRRRCHPGPHVRTFHFTQDRLTIEDHQKSPSLACSISLTFTSGVFARRALAGR
jgi:hypothetical protein